MVIHFTVVTEESISRLMRSVKSSSCILAALALVSFPAPSFAQTLPPPAVEVHQAAPPAAPVSEPAGLPTAPLSTVGGATLGPRRSVPNAAAGTAAVTSGSTGVDGALVVVDGPDEWDAVIDLGDPGATWDLGGHQPPGSSTASGGSYDPVNWAVVFNYTTIEFNRGRRSVS